MRLGTGGAIDRSRPVPFSFDGRAMSGFHGDTLASALLANGVHLAGRSFKYHRPRGIMAAGVDEPNALVTVDRGGDRTDVNRPATQVWLYPGLVARSQNRWPSLSFDAGAINDVLAPLIPAGFYYKTFLWPRTGWRRVYEPLIRKAAGLGTAPTGPDPDRYAQRWAHCDLMVVGAGPAGIAAALAAAPSGGRIILADLDDRMGGGLLTEPARAVDGVPATQWVARSLAMLEQCPNVRLLPRTTAFHHGIDNLVALAERLTDHLAPADAEGPRERYWLVRAARVVLATGAHERPMVFPGNDRPGVMLASAALAYAERWGVLPGRRIVLVAGADSGHHAAHALAAYGASIEAIIDRRPALSPALVQAAGATPLFLGTLPTGTHGRLGISSVTVGGRRIGCDLVLMAGGWTPALHLYSQAGGKPMWSADREMFLPGVSTPGVTTIGAAAGHLDTPEALADGWAAGGGGENPPSTPGPTSPAARAPLIAPDARPGRAFVDFQNDVTAKDIRLAVREGFTAIEHVKRYTTSGMATDQGRSANLNALAIAADVQALPVPAVGLTSFRAPYTPTAFGTMAALTRGALFDPVRTPPSHAAAVAMGAVFEDVGQWKRARYFPKAGEDMHAAVARECLATRHAAGLFDASTLGKIEVVGPDAAEFLNRCYVNSFTRLDVGRCRYGVLLREDGFIMDDGVIGRIAADRFHVTTTTGGAANVLAMLEDYRQTEFPELAVWLTSTTEQWATMAVNGPNARAIVQALAPQADLSAGALPHMALVACEVAGFPARLWRVSFTGEVGFEINVASTNGAALWDALLAVGAPHGLVPYGTETMHVLRAEKGYIIVGQETDGTVTPADAGLDWAIGRAKPDFIGKRSLARAAMQSPDRKQLVGLRFGHSPITPPEGAQIVAPAAPRRAIGHITSAYRSPAVGGAFALALVEGGRARMGEALQIAGCGAAGAPLHAEVTAPVFVDPEGLRLHG